jgi:parallel beta-helix repeat protein
MVTSQTQEHTERALGTILYVGGNGPGNYTSIQQAIDDASPGDTVYVYDDASPYYEHLLINKSVNLVGENRTSTVIDAGQNGTVIFIPGDRVTVSGFTLQNSSLDGFEAGVMIIGDYNTIANNIVRSNRANGVVTLCTKVDIGYNNVTGNIITENGVGVNFDSGSFNNISRNVIAGNGDGIIFDEAFNSTVSENIIENNTDTGITSTGSGNNLFLRNQIKRNIKYGVNIYITTNERFIDNNFIGNGRQAYFIQPIIGEIVFLKLKHQLPLHPNHWDGNYWGRKRVMPYPILGLVNLWFDIGIGVQPLVDCCQIDLHPAATPYNI